MGRLVDSYDVRDGLAPQDSTEPACIITRRFDLISFGASPAGCR